jgi:hypothetical protein
MAQRRFGGRGGSDQRGFSMDPNEMFNRFSGGKDVWVGSQTTDPFAQGMFTRIAERIGVTNGQITRDQYVKYMQERMGRRGGGGGPPAPPGPAAPGTPPAAPGAQPDNGANNWSAWAEEMFRRQDQNGDGYLNNDEMPEELRAERDKWDADHNGLIDLTEFKAYFEARMQQRMAERGGDGGMPGFPVPIIAPPEEEEDHKPTIYRAGKLPKELPSWFQQVDTDGDAQIGLYEWKAAGKPIREFLEMDRNHDGFLTVDEVLAYEAKKKSGEGTAVAAGGSGGPPRFNGFAPPDRRRSRDSR